LARQYRRKQLLVIFLLAILVASILAIHYGCRLMYPLRYRELVGKYSEMYDLDPLLVMSVIRVESMFRSEAVSPKNAMGLMQITPGTGKWAAEKLKLKDYSDDKLFDPDTNIRIGCWYLAMLHREFGDIDVALAAYNAGSGNVSRWLSDSRYSKTGVTLDAIPFRETKTYVKKVRESFSIYKKLYENEF
jgi:soluble lytic murein transglycosylase